MLQCQNTVKRLGKRLIRRKAEVEWAPQLPDLNPPDVFFRGFPKDNIYQGNPCTIAALKKAITEKIQTIIQDESASVINNFTRRVQHCRRQVNAEHLDHVL